MVRASSHASPAACRRRARWPPMPRPLLGLSAPKATRARRQRPQERAPSLNPGVGTRGARNGTTSKFPALGDNFCTGYQKPSLANGTEGNMSLSKSTMVLSSQTATLCPLERPPCQRQSTPPVVDAHEDPRLPRQASTMAVSAPHLYGRWAATWRSAAVATDPNFCRTSLRRHRELGAPTPVPAPGMRRLALEAPSRVASRVLHQHRPTFVVAQEPEPASASRSWHPRAPAATLPPQRGAARRRPRGD